MRIYLCPYCDTQLPDGARFCAQCGGAIAQAEAAEPVEVAAVESEPAAVKPVEAAPVVEPKALDIEPPVVAPVYKVSPRAEPSGDAVPTTHVALPMPENIAAVIAYATIVPAVVFLFLEPFRRSRFVRFHAWQHLLLFAAAIACLIAASLLWMILQLVPFMRVLVFPFAGLISLAWLFVWLLLVVKAYRHEYFKLPWIGDYAEEQSEA